MGYGGKSSEKTGPNLLKNGMLETCQVPKVGLLELSNPVLIHSTMNVPACVYSMQGLTGNVTGVCQPPVLMHSATAAVCALQQCVCQG